MNLAVNSHYCRPSYERTEGVGGLILPIVRHFRMTYVCVCVCIYIYTHTHLYIYIYIYIYLYIAITLRHFYERTNRRSGWSNTADCPALPNDVCVCVCVYTHTHTHLYIYIYIYLYIAITLRPSYERTNRRSGWSDTADYPVLPNYAYIYIYICIVVYRPAMLRHSTVCRHLLWEGDWYIPLTILGSCDRL